jgi:hypothetical protein
MVSFWIFWYFLNLDHFVVFSSPALAVVAFIDHVAMCKFVVAIVMPHNQVGPALYSFGAMLELS